MIKSKLKIPIGLLLGTGLASGALRFINRNRLCIPCYHRVLSKEGFSNLKDKNMGVYVDSFEKQMEFISKHYTAVNERDIISAIEGEAKLPEFPIWVTFDDGYKDNYTNALPSLKKYKIPATFFVTTGFINKQTMPCEDYIAQAIERTALKEVKLVINKREFILFLGTAESRNHAKKVLWGMLDKSYVPLNQYLEKLSAAFRIQPEDITGLFMDWDEIRQMSNDGFAIGAHTVSHRILSILNEDEILREISGSKYEIEKNLAKKVLSFAYPRGKMSDYHPDACYPVLRNYDFKLGVTTVGGNNNLGSNQNCFNLRRMGFSRDDTLNFFKFKINAGCFWQT